MLRSTELRPGFAALAFGLLIAAAGCQRDSEWDLVPVEGTVSRGGQPLSGIEVVFLPETNGSGPRAAGITDESGRYRLRTDAGDGGATAGKYRVLMTDAYRGALPLAGRLAKDAEHSEEARKNLAKLKGVPRVSEGYGRASETPLRAEVRLPSPGGPQSIDFQIP